MKGKRAYSYRLKETVVLGPKVDVVYTETFEEGDVEWFKVEGFEIWCEGGRLSDGFEIYDIRIDGRSLLKHESQRHLAPYYTAPDNTTHFCTPRTLRMNGKIEIWLVSTSDLANGKPLRLNFSLKGTSKMRGN